MTQHMYGLRIKKTVIDLLSFPSNLLLLFPHGSEYRGGAHKISKVTPLFSVTAPT